MVMGLPVNFIPSIGTNANNHDRHLILYHNNVRGERQERRNDLGQHNQNYGGGISKVKIINNLEFC
jgi:hypothetical protein